MFIITARFTCLVASAAAIFGILERYNNSLPGFLCVFREQGAFTVLSNWCNNSESESVRVSPHSSNSTQEWVWIVGLAIYANYLLLTLWPRTRKWLEEEFPEYHDRKLKDLGRSYSRTVTIIGHQLDSIGPNLWWLRKTFIVSATCLRFACKTLW